MQLKQDTQVKAQMLHHVEDLMEDTDLHSQEKVYTFHGAWLNQFEQGRYTWADGNQKLKMLEASCGTRPWQSRHSPFLLGKYRQKNSNTSPGQP